MIIEDENENGVHLPPVNVEDKQEILNANLATNPTQDTESFLLICELEAFIIADIETHITILYWPQYCCFEVICRVLGLIEDTTYLYLDYNTTISQLTTKDLQDFAASQLNMKLTTSNVGSTRGILRRIAVVDFILNRLVLLADPTNPLRWQLKLYAAPHTIRAEKASVSNEYLEQAIIPRPEGFPRSPEDEFKLPPHLKSMDISQVSLPEANQTGKDNEVDSSDTSNHKVVSQLLGKAWKNNGDVEGGESSLATMSLDSVDIHKTISHDMSSPGFLPKISVSSVSGKTGAAAAGGGGTPSNARSSQGNVYSLLLSDQMKASRDERDEEVNSDLTDPLDGSSAPLPPIATASGNGTEKEGLGSTKEGRGNIKRESSKSSPSKAELRLSRRSLGEATNISEKRSTKSSKSLLRRSFDMKAQGVEPTVSFSLPSFDTSEANASSALPLLVPKEAKSNTNHASVSIKVEKNPSAEIATDSK